MSETSLTPECSAWGSPLPGHQGGATLEPALSQLGAPRGPNSCLLSHTGPLSLACEHQATGPGRGRAWTHVPPNPAPRPRPAPLPLPCVLYPHPRPGWTLHPGHAVPTLGPDTLSARPRCTRSATSCAHSVTPENSLLGAPRVGTARAPFHPPYPPPPVGAQLTELVPRAQHWGPRPPGTPYPLRPGPR